MSINASFTEETKLTKAVELHQQLKQRYVSEGMSELDATCKAFNLIMSNNSGRGNETTRSI